MDRCLKFVWPLHCPRTLRMRMCYANKLPKVTTPCPPPLFHLHVKKVRTLRACCAIVGPTQLIKARPFKLSLNIYSGTGPWSGPLITPVLWVKVKPGRWEGAEPATQTFPHRRPVQTHHAADSRLLFVNFRKRTRKRGAFLPPHNLAWSINQLCSDKIFKQTNKERWRWKLDKTNLRS